MLTWSGTIGFVAAMVALLAASLRLAFALDRRAHARRWAKRGNRR